MPPEPALTPKQFDILHHTMHRAARRCYCGDSSDMQALVSRGLMKSLGKVAWCPDEYFTVTAAGAALFSDRWGGTRKFICPKCFHKDEKSYDGYCVRADCRCRCVYHQVVASMEPARAS